MYVLLQQLFDPEWILRYYMEFTLGIYVIAVQIRLLQIICDTFEIIAPGVAMFVPFIRRNKKTSKIIRMFQTFYSICPIFIGAEAKNYVLFFYLYIKNPSNLHNRYA